MKRFLAPVLCALVALAGVFGVLHNKHQTDVLNQEMYAERVTDLPEVGQAFYLTVFWHSNDPQSDPHDRQLKSWLASVPELRSLVAQCNYNEYAPGNKLTAGFAAANGFDPAHTPAIRLQDSQGNDVYYNDARGFGDKPYPIVWGIKKKLSEVYPHLVKPPKNNPWCTPCTPVQPVPAVNVNINKPPVPTIDTADEPKDISIAAAAIIAVLVFLGVFWGTKNDSGI